MQNSPTLPREVPPKPALRDAVATGTQAAASGNAVTYTAGRAKEISHADLAWACMHALDYESLAGESAGRTILEIN